MTTQEKNLDILDSIGSFVGSAYDAVFGDGGAEALSTPPPVNVDTNVVEGNNPTPEAPPTSGSVYPAGLATQVGDYLTPAFGSQTGGGAPAGDWPSLSSGGIGDYLNPAFDSQTGGGTPTGDFGGFDISNTHVLDIAWPSQNISNVLDLQLPVDSGSANRYNLGSGSFPENDSSWPYARGVGRDTDPKAGASNKPGDSTSASGSGWERKVPATGGFGGGGVTVDPFWYSSKDTSPDGSGLLQAYKVGAQVGSNGQANPQLRTQESKAEASWRVQSGSAFTLFDEPAEFRLGINAGANNSSGNWTGSVGANGTLGWGLSGYPGVYVGAFGNVSADKNLNVTGGGGLYAAGVIDNYRGTVSVSETNSGSLKDLLFGAKVEVNW